MIPTSYAADTPGDTVGGWCKCSCGVNTDCEGMVFYKNECPYCHHHSLIYSVMPEAGICPATGRWEGPHPESHIFCLNCDADFCNFCGKAHVTDHPQWLTGRHVEWFELP
jgi:hypothetical protein